MRVKSLHIYPVKGCQSVDLTQSLITASGLAQDRCWMPVGADGKVVLQWALPVLASVKVEMTKDGIALSAPDMPNIRIATPDETAPALSILLKKREMTAREATGDAHAWFTQLLGAPCKLVYKQDALDGGNPVHIVTTASLEDFSHRMGGPLPVDRFRPNIVIEGASPWEEDLWQSLNVGGLDLDISKDCARCMVIATDQLTGERAEDDGSPLAVLKSFRLKREPQPGSIFGRYAVPRGAGMIRVGDALSVKTSVAA